MKKFKVIIWGHKLHSHTHSYIHNAFFVAFKAMGYETYWFDDADYKQDQHVKDFDYSNCLFITEGQVCGSMPIIKGNHYVLHNCYNEQMWETIKGLEVDYLKLQVYTDDVLKYNLEQLENICTYYDKEGKMLYMPWATDLLPNEIEPYQLHDKTNKSWWVGTMGDGKFGNNKELAGFIKACKKHGIEFEHANNLSIEENRQKIAESFMAPAIVGTWQKEKNYIPCRIFKNISYGQFGVTNSKRVHELFEWKTVYADDESELVELMKYKMNERNYLRQRFDMIAFVRGNHTYLNRIKTILSVL